MTNTATYHQGVIETLWLQFWGFLGVRLYIQPTLWIDHFRPYL